MKILAVVRCADRGSSDRTRQALLDTNGVTRTLDMLISQRFADARVALGRGRARTRPVASKLSTQARATRRPLPPAQLIGAVGERVHLETGRSRASSSFRNRRCGPARRLGSRASRQADLELASRSPDRTCPHNWRAALPQVVKRGMDWSIRDRLEAGLRGTERQPHPWRPETSGLTRRLTAVPLQDPSRLGASSTGLSRGLFRQDQVPRPRAVLLVPADRPLDSLGQTGLWAPSQQAASLAGVGPSRPHVDPWDLGPLHPRLAP